jgi:hypothetical protein
MCHLQQDSSGTGSLEDLNIHFDFLRALQNRQAEPAKTDFRLEISKILLAHTSFVASVLGGGPVRLTMPADFRPLAAL